jgi:hypothetical protein
MEAPPMRALPRLSLLPIHGGLGVFADGQIYPDTIVLEFTGERVPREAVLQAARAGAADGFLQVGDNEFIGLSGRMDDYVNHSCEPNCGIDFRGDQVFLKAVRSIARGQELTFDYASTQSDFPFRFHCLCASPSCRGQIGNFEELSRSTRQYYESLGIVPRYLRERPGSITKDPNAVP